MKSSNKANMEISISWIFMIIIGGFFLILAFNIVSKYQEQEELKFQIELKQALRGILNTAGRTSGIEEDSLKKIGPIFKDSKIEMTCYKNFSNLKINGFEDTNNDYLRNYPSFMTYIEQGKTQNSYLIVENFRLPFKITNLLAIVSKKNLIIFNENNQISKKLLKKFNENSYKNNLNYITLNFNNIKYEDIKKKTNKENLNSIILVSDKSNNINPEITKIINELEIYTSLVEFKEYTKEYGEITITDLGETNIYDYYDYDDSQSIETMAILSKREIFSCSYKQILKSIKNNYEFYINKSNYLSNLSENIQICSSSIPKEIQSLRYKELSLILESSKNELNTNKLNKPENIKALLTVQEKEIEFIDDFNCPYVY